MTTRKIVCGTCGGNGYHGKHDDFCTPCQGTGERVLDKAMLEELRQRSICVSGSEVEGLLDMIRAHGEFVQELRYLLLSNGFWFNELEANEEAALLEGFRKAFTALKRG